MDSSAGLPGRPVLLESLAEMIEAGESPGVFAISIDGFEDLPGNSGEAGARAMVELAGRLSRLVRSNDVLAVLAPGIFALAGAGVEQMDAAVVLERIRGVFAMPVEVGGHLVSLPVTMGVAHFGHSTSASGLLDSAERDLAANGA